MTASRYELLVKVASGGMATVYVGRLSANGSSHLVAIKRAHSHLLEDASFARALVTEARLASMIDHPNVCSVRDVEETDGELLLVMDYVEGASLAAVWSEADKAQVSIPPSVAIRVVLDACAGLQAAHELTNDRGVPLGVVHRDVTPHNILIGLDGVARLADFGIARVSTTSTIGGPQTTTGIIKGKIGYMAPEYVETTKVDARGDVFSLGVVAWEALAHRRMFKGQTDVETLKMILTTDPPPISSVVPALAAFDEVFKRALARSPDARFQTARDFAIALEDVARRANLIAPPADVGVFVSLLVGPALESRRATIRAKTADAPPSAPDPELGRTTATLPIAGPVVEVTQPHPSRPSHPSHPTSTFGGGAAAITVDSSDHLMAPPQRRFVPFVVGIMVVIVAVTTIGLLVTNMHSAAPPKEAPSAVAVAPAPAPTPTPTPSAVPSVVPSATASARPPAPRPAVRPPAPRPLETAAPNPYAK